MQNYMFFMASSGGAGTEIFATNAINLNGTDEYLTADNASKYNLGTQTLSTASRFVFDGVNKLYLAGKYDETPASRESGFVVEARADQIRFTLQEVTGGIGGSAQYAVFSAPTTLIAGAYTVVVSWDRSSHASHPNVYINAVAIAGSWITDTIPNKHLVDYTSTAVKFEVGSLQSSGRIYAKAPAITSIAYDDLLMQADVTLFHNAGQAQCWDIMDAGLKSKFTAYWQLITFTGHTSVDALADRVAGEILDNIGDAPFDLAGLSVECNA